MVTGQHAGCENAAHTSMVAAGVTWCRIGQTLVVKQHCNTILKKYEYLAQCLSTFHHMSEMNDAMTVGDCVPLHAASVTAIGSELANVHAICSHKLQPLDV